MHKNLDLDRKINTHTAVSLYTSNGKVLTSVLARQVHVRRLDPEVGNKGLEK